MSEWQNTTLGDVITLHYGKALKTQNRIVGNIPVYSSAGITGYHNEPLVMSKGIIIGRKGTVGKVYYSPEPFWCIDTAYYVLPNETKYDFIWLYYQLGTIGLEELNEDSAVPGLNRTTAYSQDILIPSIAEQKAIASVLSSLDDKIDLLHRQNKTLESMAETLFRQWFVEEAQDDWVHGTLKDEFAFTMGQSPKGSSFNEEQIGTPMFQGNADFGFRFPKERVYTTEPTRFAQKLDTLISVRAPVGAQNMARSKCCIGRGVAAFRHINNPDWYTYTYFKLRCLMDEIKKFNDEGTVFGSISKSDFEKIEVIIPPASIIHNYEIMVKPLNDRVITNCFQIEKLEKLRDTLLPKLMSGEVRVSYTPEEIKQ
ncbi:restriction endonuclease subunit S [Providencia stuartii]|uniref:Type I restriction modification DNA specificity domain protein n=1 Tax=Providencia stuartii ATCC 25827 TaxID=471874 RepID=A0AA86YMC0_PROST|nr:restriction endonuclease subunit S [Providencia stuartii]EDU60547.1 type I restriction modification DNA specificity domain protein [Providencia stuartii ATCC 25827]ELT5686124.1 restriction endonuclease subunit S [Providencia rettgeri]